MNDEKLYRYTADGEGVWSAGKRLLPENLIEEANEQRAWLYKPTLPAGNYRFFLTEKGKRRYEQTLLHTHRKYLGSIRCEEIDASTVGEIVYQDEHQIVTRV
ncbi:MAG: hypothetical protein Q7S95_01560 [bacterium]|nr:hypothetical protein [bacterium]